MAKGIFIPDITVEMIRKASLEAIETLLVEGEMYDADMPKWIPCSERLPDEFGEYLVTKKAIGWNCEEYNSNDIAYFDNEGFHKADKVLAWMPLPKPYGGESDETN